MRIKLLVGILMIGIAVALAAGWPGRAAADSDGPEEAFLKYMTAIKENRIDDALPLLAGEEAANFFAVSFRYAKSGADLSSAKNWNAAITGQEELLKRLPFWRERVFNLKTTGALVVGRNARVFFTYQSVGTPSPAVQDMVFEDGQWRVAYRR